MSAETELDKAVEAFTSAAFQAMKERLEKIEAALNPVEYILFKPPGRAHLWEQQLSGTGAEKIDALIALHERAKK